MLLSINNNKDVFNFFFFLNVTFSVGNCRDELKATLEMDNKGPKKEKKKLNNDLLCNDLF